MSSTNTIEYHPNSQKITQLLFAGAVSTIAFLIGEAILSALFGYFGYIETIRAMLTQDPMRPDMVTGAWWTAFFVALVSNVVAFPLLYDLLNTKSLVSAKRLSRGVAWGLFLGVLVQALLAPAAGYGFFKSNLPYTGFQVVVSLLLWAFYGTAFERFTRVRFVHELNSDSQKAA